MNAVHPNVQLQRSVRYPGFRVSELRYPGSFRQPPHTHDTTSVTPIVAGSVEELVGNRREQARACSVVVKPAGTEHCDWYGDRGAWTLAFELEPAFLAELDEHVLRHWRWSHCGPAARILIRVLQAIRSQTDRHPGRLDENLLDLLAVLADEENAEPEELPPSWVESARGELDRRRGSPFRVRDTAAVFGVHPVYFTRQFRRYHGCSPTTYLARTRLQQAADLMTSTRISFARVAHGSGFADQSHLCRAFKSSLGVTPKGYRHLVAGRE